MRSRSGKPVPSYGLVVYCQATSRVLIYSRRDSIEYIVLLRGIWKDFTQARFYLSHLRKEELERMRTHTFDELWADLWVTSRTASPRERERWNRLMENEEFRSELMSLDETEPFSSWGFPKGRKNSGEAPVAAALREFTEETSLSLPLLLLRRSLYERFTGSDGKWYSTKYFLALTPEEPPAPEPMTLPGDRIRTTTLSSEASGVEWVTLEEAAPLLSETHRTILRRALEICQVSERPRHQALRSSRPPWSRLLRAITDGSDEPSKVVEGDS